MAKSKEEIENGYCVRIDIDINILVKVSQSNKHTQNTHIYRCTGHTHTYT